MCTWVSRDCVLVQVKCVPGAGEVCVGAGEACTWVSRDCVLVQVKCVPGAGEVCTWVSRDCVLVQVKDAQHAVGTFHYWA